MKRTLAVAVLATALIAPPGPANAYVQAAELRPNLHGCVSHLIRTDDKFTGIRDHLTKIGGTPATVPVAIPTNLIAAVGYRECKSPTGKRWAQIRRVRVSAEALGPASTGQHRYTCLLFRKLEVAIFQRDETPDHSLGLTGMNIDCLKGERVLGRTYRFRAGRRMAWMKWSDRQPPVAYVSVRADVVGPNPPDVGWKVPLDQDGHGGGGGFRLTEAWGP